jgi:hypothetical protein
MTDTAKTDLPEAFGDLEGYLEKWAKPTFHERYKQRMASSQEELKAFYDAMLPRMDDLTGHLNRFHPGQLPASLLPLFFLACSFMDIAAAVEIYEQPDVPLGLEWWRPQMTECKTPIPG